MSHLHIDQLAQINRDRHAELLHQAAIQRLLRTAHVEQMPWRERIARSIAAQVAALMPLPHVKALAAR